MVSLAIFLLSSESKFLLIILDAASTERLTATDLISFNALAFSASISFLTNQTLFFFYDVSA